MKYIIFSSRKLTANQPLFWAFNSLVTTNKYLKLIIKKLYEMQHYQESIPKSGNHITILKHIHKECQYAFIQQNENIKESI